jgi:subtilisin family serine protease
MIMNLFPQRGATLLRNARSLCAISSIALIAGCGGGGGGDSAIDTCTPIHSSPANATLCINSGITSGSITTTYESTRVALNYGARAHLSDVGPLPEAPGQGTTIMVIDDFYATLASTTTLPPIMRTINAQTNSSSVPERYSATYSIPYQIDTPITHGNLVSNIAGGYTTGPSTLTLKVPANNSADLVSCKPSFQATLLKCPTAFHNNAPASTLTAKLSMSAIPGVASKSAMESRHVDLSKGQNAIETNAIIYGHLHSSLLSANFDVINLSLGSDMPLSTNILKDLQNIVDAKKIDFSINSVITVSAGNSSKPCSVDYLGCNTMALAMSLQPNTFESTIVVGALTGTGSAEKIAIYSTLPGDLASRFIYASGDTGFYGDAVGTSFAAPRVAGVAAIIKQQFPKLTSVQIASIILLSADRDINNDGKPDFEFKPGEVSDPFYGRGKLSLKNALALAATY